uniref:Uncharacterized protein n=1 Tax=Timema poppense TaxID=170557 RepID=A0A7R9DW19_TIMPO|nr:unnamed protein product [Timema poppensis]
MCLTSNNADSPKQRREITYGDRVIDYCDLRSLKCFVSPHTEGTRTQRYYCPEAPSLSTSCLP